MNTTSAIPARSRAAFAGIAVAALAAGALAGCSSAKSGGSGAKPAAAGAASSSAPAGDPHKAAVSITAADGCSVDKTTFPAGQVTFEIANKDATAVSEVELQSGQRIVGEKENLPPGFTGSFTVAVDAGSYALYCPGSGKPNQTLTVTGTAPTSADGDTATLLAQGAKEYASYVNTQMGYLVSTSQALQTALKGSDLDAAQKAYMKARPYYEKIEPVAESFTSGSDNLDADIALNYQTLPGWPSPLFIQQCHRSGREHAEAGLWCSATATWCREPIGCRFRLPCSKACCALPNRIRPGRSQPFSRLTSPAIRWFSRPAAEKRPS